MFSSVLPKPAHQLAEGQIGACFAVGAVKLDGTCCGPSTCGTGVSQPAAAAASAITDAVRNKNFMRTTRYSLANATTGSSRAAFIAGAKPNTSPVATAHVKAIATGARV